MNNNSERLESLFSKVLSLFERFVDRVEQEVIEPLVQGGFNEVSDNLSKLGIKASLDRLLFAIVRNFEAIVRLRRRLDKHYNSENNTEKFVIEEDEIDQKFSDFLIDMQKLKKI